MLKPHKNAPHICSLLCNCKFKMYRSAVAIYCAECGELQCIYVSPYMQCRWWCGYWCVGTPYLLNFI